MLFTAVLQFTQGVTVNEAGRSMRSVTLGSFTAASVGDQTGVIETTFRLLDGPDGSALGPFPKLLQQGDLTTVSISPDVSGSYQVQLTTSDGVHTQTTIKLFTVLTRRNWILEAFKSRDDQYDYPSFSLRGYTSVEEFVKRDILAHALFLDERNGAADGQTWVWSDHFAQWIPGSSGGGGGGVIPLGTGFVHITGHTQDVNAKLVADADVDNAAGIQGAKIVADFKAQSVKGNAFLGTSGAAWTAGVQSIALPGGGGPLTLGAGQIESHILSLTGSGTYPVTVFLPPPVEYTVFNNSSATATLKIVSDVSTGVILAPGQAAIVYSSGGMLRGKALGGSGPVAQRFSVDLFKSVSSTITDGTVPLVVGRVYFDPNSPAWNLSGSSVVTLYMMLETTNPSNPAMGDIYRKTPGAMRGELGTPASSASPGPTVVLIDVSSSFIPGQSAGIFEARLWLTSNNGVDVATCSGAWLEFQP